MPEEKDEFDTTNYSNPIYPDGIKKRLTVITYLSIPCKEQHNSIKFTERKEASDKSIRQKINAATDKPSQRKSVKSEKRRC